MTNSIKIKTSIQSRLEKIRCETFIEDDIKILLIDIREKMPQNSLLREFADFIAHPIRDKGIFNKSLNTRYIKLKLIRDQYKRLDLEQKENFKTERQLSDFLLGGININKVDKHLFELLFIDGLQDIGDKVFRDHYPLTKGQVYKLIKSSYQLDHKKEIYELKNSDSYMMVDDALKFIRGTIHAKPVFNQQTFEKEIIRAIAGILNEYNLDKAYLAAVKNNLKPILLCILCLLHDAKFTFHDNHVGTCFLSFYAATSTKSTKEKVFALITDDIGIQMPIFVSNIKIADYIDSEELNNFNAESMERMPWINAKRDKSNNLIITT